MDAHELIRKTAEAIQNGTKAYKIIEDPHKILSGSMKKIILNRMDNGLIIYEEQAKELEQYGLDISQLEWKSKFNGKMKYIVFQERDNKILVDAVEAGILKDFSVFEVPVEDWAWVIKFMKKPNGGTEYVEMYL